MKKAFIFFFLISAYSGMAQLKLNGKITNETTGNPLVFAEILLINDHEELSNVTDENGLFLFEELNSGNYSLQVIENFETIYSDSISLDSDLEKNIYVKLSETISLDEAVVMSKVFKKKADRFIFDVAASPIAKGNDAFQLLKETPLVSSTDDKSLKILGKSNAIIYINGRKSNMDTEAILEMLKNTQADQIQRIEIITVPGSEFQIEGNDGIINIVMKKSSTDGYNARIQVNDNQAYFNNIGTNAGFNFRKNKLAVNTSAYVSGYKEKEDFELSNGNDTFRNESNGDIVDPNFNVGGSVNVDYEINAKQNIGFIYNLRYNKSFNSQIDMYNSLNGNLSNRSLQTEDAQTRNHSFNLNYELKTDSLGSKLSTNVSYLWYNRNREAKNETFPFDQSEYKAFRQWVPQKINNVGANVDYTWKTKKEDTWLFGGNYNYTKTDNDTRQDNLENGVFVNDAVLSNFFKYSENIVGLYVTYERQFGEKFSGKLGLRYEITKTDGDIMGKDNSFENNYSNILPYTSLNYAINPNNNLSYTFSSRVRRPAFWELNPSRTYFTPTNYLQNNPFMVSSKYYNNELTYMFKSAYFMTLGYEFTNDASGQLPFQGKVIENATGLETEFLRYIRTNYGDRQQLSLTLGMNKDFFKGIWNTNYSVSGSYEKFSGTVSQDPTYVAQPGFTEILNPYIVDSDNLVFYMQFNNNIRLSADKTWFLGINYWYLSPKQIELGELGQLHSFDLSLKKIWNNWTFIVEGKDLFNTNIEIIKGIQPNGSYNNVRNYNYNRELNVKVTFTFGNQKLKKAREVDAANSSIKSRM